METLLALLTSSGTGGLIGMFGSWLTKREERKNNQLKFEYELKMSEIRKEEAKLEADHELAMADKQMERAKVEGDVAIEKSEVDAFIKSVESQSKATGVTWVDGLRGLMRPIITIYLLAIATYIAFKVSSLVGGLSSLEETAGGEGGPGLRELYQTVITQILFLTSTAVTWWFGSRPSSQRKDK